jgi:hypothetical protein
VNVTDVVHGVEDEGHVLDVPGDVGVISSAGDVGQPFEEVLTGGPLVPEDVGRILEDALCPGHAAAARLEGIIVVGEQAGVLG